MATKPKRDKYDAATGAIRRHMKVDGEKEWGLCIVRCTYASQERWERYISIIQGHIQDFIRHDSNALLRETLDCPILEDQSRLDGATWKQARARFDEWVLDEIKAAPPPNPRISRSPYLPEKNIEYDINRTPRWEYFIYADQASVDSVVDCTSEDPKTSPNDYWMLVVTTALIQPRIYHVDEDTGVWIPDSEEDDSWKGLYHKIKAQDFVPAYSRMLADRFVDLETKEDGICDIVW